ncbi:MAG TPA: hypothetical protein VKP68_14250 [Ramlibacter sp.]|nr:hypothetical protein [Ramlibacter sp.]
MASYYPRWGIPILAQTQTRIMGAQRVAIPSWAAPGWIEATTAPVTSRMGAAAGQPLPVQPPLLVPRRVPLAADD